MGLIAVNLAAVILETVEPLSASFGAVFHAFEVFSVVVFTAEYLGRVWSIVEDEDFSSPVTGRLRFATKPLLVVDLLAIAPFYLTLAGVGLRPAASARASLDHRLPAVQAGALHGRRAHLGKGT